MHDRPRRSQAPDPDEPAAPVVTDLSSAAPGQLEAELRDLLAREEALLAEKDRLLIEKELLNREADHRLLNSLQMVASLLSMQGRLSDDPAVAAELEVAARRVIAIGNVHRRLHALDHARTVELLAYLETLCADIAAMIAVDGRENKVVVEGIRFEVATSTGIPIGFIASELITNAAKYAGGQIRITLAPHEARYALTIADEGPGLPDAFDPSETRGLGMVIVQSLVRQIGGELKFGRNPRGPGAFFTVLFS